MAHYTVIKSDTAIYIDGVSIDNCDMSGLPEDFWALQWDGSDGEIEYVGNVKLNLTISSESQIESELGVSLSTLIERRDAAEIANVAEIKRKNDEWEAANN